MMVDWVFIGLSTSPSSSSSSSILLEEWSCSSRWNAFSKSETTSLQGGGKTDIHASMLLLAFIHQYIHVSIHSDTHIYMYMYIHVSIHVYHTHWYIVSRSGMFLMDRTHWYSFTSWFSSCAREPIRAEHSHSFHSVSFTISYMYNITALEGVYLTMALEEREKEERERRGRG